MLTYQSGELAQLNKLFYVRYYRDQKQTTATMTTFKNQLLETLAEQIKAAGYQVYYYDNGEPATWMYYGDAYKVAYCQLDEWNDRVRFSSVHKPCRKFGSGFGMHAPYEGETAPTVAIAEKAFSYMSQKPTAKYAGVTEYISSQKILKYEKF
jgi:hypothetical protein